MGEHSGSSVGAASAYSAGYDWIDWHPKARGCQCESGTYVLTIGHEWLCLECRRVLEVPKQEASDA